MRTDSDMADFCDSPKSKEHPLFGTDAKALQLLLYFDDLELCNPIGAFRKKHKVGKCFPLSQFNCISIGNKTNWALFHSWESIDTKYDYDSD